MNPRTKSRRSARRHTVRELVMLSTAYTGPILAIVQQAEPLPVIR